MKVFIENEAGSNKKNIYNEKTLEFKKLVQVSREYPYPYGFILNTTSGDGDNLDCFVLTEKVLRAGDIVDCEPIGLMLQKEDDEEDSNVLASLENETFKITDKTKNILSEFVLHVFDHIEGKRNEVGEFLGKKEAQELIEQCKD